MQEHTGIGASVGGWALNSHDRPAQTFAPGRVCAEYDCFTRLSIYNGSCYCSLHELCVVPITRGKRAA